MRITLSISTLASAAAAALLSMPAALLAQSEEVTFHKDIEPILQRSCQSCHRDGGAGPMPLVTYEQVAPYAGLIEYKTGLRDRAGAMPPWYMEKDIGIQDYKDDPSLSDEELAAISTWARSGTPKGDIADAPEPLVFDDSIKWRAGEPDLVVVMDDITKLAGTPDWWGEIPSAPTGLTE
ncbi:MAG: c-type cytochrome, partial [Pseudohongiellaceae bacterium]